jgi:hypothetical protein
MVLSGNFYYIFMTKVANNYHNPNLGLVTKARAYKGAGQE